MESRPGVTIQRGIMTRVNFQRGILTGVLIPRGIMTRVTFQCGIMTRGYNSTFNYDPGSKFHVEWWPWVWISHWILIPIPGLYLTLNHDSGSTFNVEFRNGVIIQCGIKTRGHNSTGVQILSVGGVVIQWPPVSGVAIQHEKSVESWAQPVESRPHGSKFNGVKIQSYTGRRYKLRAVRGIHCFSLQIGLDVIPIDRLVSLRNCSTIIWLQPWCNCRMFLWNVHFVFFHFDDTLCQWRWLLYHYHVFIHENALAWWKLIQYICERV